MKKIAIINTILLFLCLISSSLYQICSREHIYPFIFRPQTDISWQWYIKDIGEILNSAFLSLIGFFTLQPAISYMRSVKWTGRNGLLLFLITWKYVFLWIAIIQACDLIHYLVSFKQIKIFFLITNAVFVGAIIILFNRLYNSNSKWRSK